MKENIPIKRQDERYKCSDSMLNTYSICLCELRKVIYNLFTHRHSAQLVPSFYAF